MKLLEETDADAGNKVRLACFKTVFKVHSAAPLS